MSHYDDPPEPTEAEIAAAEAEAAAKNTPIRIEGVTLGVIEYVLRGIIESNYAISSRLEDELKKAVERHVSRLIDSTTKERIAARVDALIDEGFPEFDYSGREKSRTTVKDIVMKALNEKHGDEYRGGRKTLATIAVENAVQKVFDKELQQQIAELKNDLRKQVDGALQSKIIAGMKEALGLRA